MRSWEYCSANASLGNDQRQTVLAYLLAHAADSPQAGREGRKFAQSIPAGQSPLRITDTPRWVREHRQVLAAR